MIVWGSMQGRLDMVMCAYVVLELYYETACIEVHVFWSSFSQRRLDTVM